MERCNGCSISNDKTFPFIAIYNVYERYVFFRRLVCILVSLNIILVSLLIYFCYDLYFNNDPFGHLEDTSKIINIEEDIKGIEEESYYNRKPIKNKRRRIVRF